MTGTTTKPLVDTINEVTGVAKQKMAESKALVHQPAGAYTVDATAPPAQNYEGDGSDLVESDGGKLIVECYPIYAPVPGITLRIASQQSGVAARWVDITMDEAYAIMADLGEMIEEVEKVDAGPDSKSSGSWRESTVETVKPVSWHWALGVYDPEVHPEDKEGKIPVIMSNHPETPAAWFTTEKAASEIVERLNSREA